MNAHRFVLSMSCMFFALNANDFYDINALIQDEDYTQALEMMEETKLSLITKKRLLARLAQQWPSLSSKNKKMFDVMLSDLLPADQTFVENTRERYMEIEEKEADYEEAPSAKPDSKPHMVKAEEKAKVEKAEQEKPKHVISKKVKVPASKKPTQKPKARAKVAPKKSKVEKPIEAVPVPQPEAAQPPELHIREEL